MKSRIAVVLCMALAFVLFLDGCTSLKIVSVDSLIRAPKLTGENASLQEAFEKSLKNAAVALKTPASGDSRSSYVFHDIDNDGLDEAFVFYALKSASNDIRVNVLSRDSSGEWESVADFQGAGNEVYSIEFVDMNDDGYKEILVSWQFADSKGNKNLSIYTCEHPAEDSGKLKVSLLKQDQYTEMISLDMNFDGKTELFLAVIDIAALEDVSATLGKAVAKLLVLEKDESDGSLIIYTKSRVELDQRAVAYKPLKYDIYEYEEDKYTCRVYLDAEIKDASGMFTEIVCWDMEYGRLISPLLVSGSVTNMRDIKTESRDFNSDGIIEMPSYIPVSGSGIYEENRQLTDTVYINVWWRYEKDDRWTVVERYIENKVDNYRFSIPEDWIGLFAVSIDTTAKKMSFYELNKENKSRGDLLFDIYACSEKAWQSLKDKNLELLKEDNNVFYVCEIAERGMELGEAMGIDIESINELIWFLE